MYVETIPSWETIPKNGISKLYSHLEQDNIWLCDFLDCYLTEDDCKLCGTLLAEKFKLWIKCIHDANLKPECTSEIYVQPCFLCIECPYPEDVKFVNDCLIKSPYKYINLHLFPWMQSAYYEDPPVACDGKFP